jgi:hypothetical protein
LTYSARTLTSILSLRERRARSAGEGNAAAFIQANSIDDATELSVRIARLSSVKIIAAR